ncbi:hypothetical protein [Amycolatopsis sp. FDAARGOS 1241]|uniref:hypothetical protein n=1 Tax=Amycolatopsis sp. FDAARGOS 1241 TaxID=2778070 RepID=UPI001952887D|nr:hypothetical protein [Amycolatopsis sp. FDAARGOS 1241]QRP44300.1 hypothetical protein I6J71_34240 [Amycolatopsis sp. FDAARGOS 1241]
MSLGTDLVLIGIGDNDYGVFGDLVGTCPTVRAQDPAGAPCRSTSPSAGWTPWRRRSGTPAAKSPRSCGASWNAPPGATSVLVGYPRPRPPTGTCLSVIPFADGDYAWADGVERELNASIA